MEKRGSVVEQEVIKEYNERALKYGLEGVLSAGANDHINLYHSYMGKRWIRKYMPVNKNDVLLDFGCGPGRLSKLFAPMVKHITGIDASDEMIKIARSYDLPNVSFLSIKNDIPDMGNTIFTKMFFNWVLIHINDSTINRYLNQLLRYISADTKCYVFEQTNLHQRTSPTEIHIHRTKEEYIQLFSTNGWTCDFTTRVYRVPSYGLGIWKKFNWLPNTALPLLALVDAATLYRKPTNIDYTTEVFVFSRK